jgi:hypothetical protein
MSENKKKKVFKKTEKKISIKKENLEKFVEKKENSREINKSKIIPENFLFENVKSNKKINVSLNKINSSEQQKVHFLERNLGKETNISDGKKNDSEYISRTTEKENPKYQHYESDAIVKLSRQEEINPGWKKASQEKNVGFINSENANLNPQTYYENYVRPERFEPVKFNREKKNKAVGKVEMKYSSNH